MIDGLPKRLKELRMKYGYSQRKIADYLNVSASIISGYETGERTPSAEMLLALSYLYQCSTDYILGRENVSSSMLLNAEGLTADQISALARLIQTIRE